MAKPKKAAIYPAVTKDNESATKKQKEAKRSRGRAASAPEARTGKIKRGKGPANKSMATSTPRRGKSFVRGLRRSARIAAQAA